MYAFFLAEFSAVFRFRCKLQCKNYLICNRSMFNTVLYSFPVLKIFSTFRPAILPQDSSILQLLLYSIHPLTILFHSFRISIVPLHQNLCLYYSTPFSFLHRIPYSIQPSISNTRQTYVAFPQQLIHSIHPSTSATRNCLSFNIYYQLNYIKRSVFTTRCISSYKPLLLHSTQPIYVHYLIQFSTAATPFMTNDSTSAFHC